MASYKTFFMLFIVGVISTQGLTISRLTSSEDDSNAPKVKDFIFSDDYFNDKQSQASANQETLKNCEKIIKDGMICLICKEPENNGKYEQCAYVSHPRKKSLSYQKNKSESDIDEIETKPNDEKKQPSRRRLETDESDEYFIDLPQKEDRKSKEENNNEKVDDDDDDDNNDNNNNNNNYNNDEDDDDDSDDDENQKDYSSDYVSKSEKLSKNMEDDNCDEVEKDGMICMQCKNAKTGGKYERCSSAYQPKDKVYKFSTSKSFGYPSKNKNPKKEKSQSYKRIDDKTYKQPRSDETIEDKSDSINCRTVIKDSMTCQVCLDPHTQENSEQCSYSYDPDDKVYAYSKSRSFGTPKKYRE